MIYSRHVLLFAFASSRGRRLKGSNYGDGALALPEDTQIEQLEVISWEPTTKVFGVTVFSGTRSIGY